MPEEGSRAWERAHGIVWPPKRSLEPRGWVIASPKTPTGRKLRPHVRNHGGPLLHVKSADLAAAGVERVLSRVVGAFEGKPMLSDGLVFDVANVVWCTGFRQDFSWIQLPIIGSDGWPRAGEHGRRAAHRDDMTTTWFRHGTWQPGNVPLPEQHLLGIVAGAVLQRRRPWTLGGPRPAQRLLGGVLIAAATAIAVRSVVAAGDAQLGHTDRLVTLGPYAVVRNPMYGAWALLHLGIGLESGSGWIIATMPGSAYAVHRTVVAEERALEARFGQAYIRYRMTVPRYLPRWRARPARRG